MNKYSYVIVTMKRGGPKHINYIGRYTVQHNCDKEARLHFLKILISQGYRVLKIKRLPNHGL